VVVSNNSQLKAALNAATQNTVIQLSSGTYSLNLKNADYHGATITSASGANVSFSGVTLTSVSNLHFDGVDFLDSRQSDVNLFKAAGSSNVSIRNATLDGNVDASGVGRGTGVSLSNVDGFVLENTEIHGFKRGAYILGADDLKLRGNDFHDIAWDGMIVAGVHGGIFDGNTIELALEPGIKHTDGIQFYNSGTNDPSSDLLIRNNLIVTHDKSSHGIFMGNALADSTGKASTFYSDVTIEHNTIVTGNVSGIAVGETNGLVVEANTILQDTRVDSRMAIYTPVIRVDRASTDVSITDNVTHLEPVASGANWAPIKAKPAGWTIEDNILVPTGIRPENAPEPGTTSKPAPAPSGNGVADLFRFDAKGETDVVRGLDFKEGDVIELYNYKGGTFFNIKDDNSLMVTIHRAVLDSLADIRELDKASDKIGVRDAGNDTLAIDIWQKAGTHTIEIHDLVESYFDLA
jgi:hypothetical protein